MSIGRLYDPATNELIGEVDYQLQDDSDTKWWGELVLTVYKRIGDSGAYILVLEDDRSGRCFIKKRVNRAVAGVPPRYIYHFSGTGPLE
ncbi:hypothetical protein ACFLTW_05745 [Chloroflexota bacterium]